MSQNRPLVKDSALVNKLVSLDMIERRDLELPTPLPALLYKIQNYNIAVIQPHQGLTIHEWCMSYRGVDLDVLFRDLLKRLLCQSAAMQVNGSDLIDAYIEAVELVASETTTQFITYMFVPHVFAEFLNYFQLPVPENVIDELELRDPQQAQECWDTSRRWMTGTY